MNTILNRFKGISKLSMDFMKGALGNENPGELVFQKSLLDESNRIIPGVF